MIKREIRKENHNNTICILDKLKYFKETNQFERLMPQLIQHIQTTSFHLLEFHKTGHKRLRGK